MKRDEVEAKSLKTKDGKEGIQSNVEKKSVVKRRKHKVMLEKKSV